jgi:hypothetical protein
MAPLDPSERSGVQRRRPFAKARTSPGWVLWLYRTPLGRSSSTPRSKWTPRVRLRRAREDDGLGRAFRVWSGNRRSMRWTTRPSLIRRCNPPSPRSGGRFGSRRRTTTPRVRELSAAARRFAGRQECARCVRGSLTPAQIPLPQAGFGPRAVQIQGDRAPRRWEVESAAASSWDSPPRIGAQSSGDASDHYVQSVDAIEAPESDEMKSPFAAVARAFSHPHPRVGAERVR